MRTTNIPENVSALDGWIASRRLARFLHYERERQALRDFFEHELATIDESERKEYQDDLALRRAKEEELRKAGGE